QSPSRRKTKRNALSSLPLSASTSMVRRCFNHNSAAFLLTFAWLVDAYQIIIFRALEACPIQYWRNIVTGRNHHHSTAQPTLVHPYRKQLHLQQACGPATSCYANETPRCNAQ